MLVSILGNDDDLPLAAKLVSMCWDAKLKARYLVNKRLSKHLDCAKEFGIPWIVMVGEKEITKGVVKLQNKDAKVEKEVPTSDFVDELVRLINPPQSRVTVKQNWYQLILMGLGYLMIIQLLFVLIYLVNRFSYFEM